MLFICLHKLGSHKRGREELMSELEVMSMCKTSEVEMIPACRNYGSNEYVQNK